MTQYMAHVVPTSQTHIEAAPQLTQTASSDPPGFRGVLRPSGCFCDKDSSWQHVMEQPASDCDCRFLKF